MYGIQQERVGFTGRAKRYGNACLLLIAEFMEQCKGDNTDSLLDQWNDFQNKNKNLINPVDGIL